MADTFDENSAGTLRRAAAQMRSKAGASADDEWIRAAADWLDSAVTAAESAEAEGASLHPDSHVLKVAVSFLASLPADGWES